MTTRRLFLATLLSSCSRAQSGVRLRARPVESPTSETTAGVIPLELRKDRDVLFYVPKSAPDPAPLVLYLHGATG
jgi:poly(3-hydroxybutyrate) depolymerase